MTLLAVDGPCGVWNLDTDACPDFAELSPVTGTAATAAINILYRLTGRRYGTCDVVIRPCAIERNPFASSYNSGGSFPPSLTPHVFSGSSVVPVLTADTVFPLIACGSCSPASRTTLDLPFRTAAVTDVTIEGVAQDLSEFAILDHRTVIWQSPDGTKFPVDQDLNAPLGDPDTWSITVTVGTPPPPDAAHNLGILACEFAKSLSNLKCRLPRTVASLARQGVNYTFVNENYLREGLVGLADVDLWIASVNPYRNTQSPTIHSPDIATTPHRVQTWIGS